MYHFVRNDSSEYPNLHHLKVDDFIKQLDFFEKNEGFLSQEDFIHCIDKKKFPQKGVVLTFDDGLRDHYSTVLPILEERKLWGFFYIPTLHYENKKILTTHRIHHLLGKYDPRTLLSALKGLFSPNMVDPARLAKFKNIYTDQSLTHAEFEFKRLFNYHLKDKYKEIMLDRLVEEFLDEGEIYKDLYLTQDELIEIEKQGSVVGSHTRSHRVLSSLSSKKQEGEIKGSLNFLNSFLKMGLNSFCYPYGGRETYNKSTQRILKKQGVHHAFAVLNKPLNSFKNKYELCRIDCNRFQNI